MKVNIKGLIKENSGKRTLRLYILLLMLLVLTMGILLYFYGPAIKEIQIPYFQKAKKHFLIIVIIYAIIIKVKNKLA